MTHGMLSDKACWVLCAPHAVACYADAHVRLCHGLSLAEEGVQWLEHVQAPREMCTVMHRLDMRIACACLPAS